MLLAPRGRARGPHRGARAAGVRQRRQAALRWRATRVGFRRRQPPVLRRCRALHAGPGNGGVPRRLHRRCSGASRSASSAQITPWNYPLMMARWKIGPALAPGNTIMLKPAEIKPLTTLRLAELATRGPPAGHPQRDHRGRRAGGAALVRHPDVAMASLTGDDVDRQGGRSGAAASSLKRVHLELGGKAPVGGVRRRRPRDRLEGVKFSRLLEPGPGVHGRLAGDRGTGRVRRAASRPRRRGGVASKIGDPRRRRGDRAGDLPSQQEASSGSSSGRGRGGRPP